MAWDAPTRSWCRGPASCGRCRALRASRPPKRNTTSAHACRHRPRLAGASQDRHGTLPAHRAAWGGGAAQRAARRISRFRPAARAGPGRGARPGCDAGGIPVTRPLEDLLAGAENVEAVRSSSSQGPAAIQVVFGRNSDPYLQRQVITERLADSSALLPAGSESAAALAAELLHGVPAALWLHERAALAARAA